MLINQSPAWASAPSLPQLLAKQMDSACLMRMGEVEVTNTFNDLCRPETLAPAQSERAAGEDVLDSGTTAAVDEDALVARQIYGRRRRWKRP